MKNLIYSIIIGFVAFPACLIAQVIDPPKGELTSIGDKVYFLRDATGQLSFEDVLTLQEEFTPVTTPIPNFGMTSDVIWIKFSLAPHTEEMQLEIGNPGLHFVDFYYLGESNYEVIQTGNLRDFDTRPVNNDFFVFPVPESKDVQTFYIRVQSEYYLNIPMEIGSQKAIEESKRGRWIFYAWFTGTMLALFLYNLFILLMTRRLAYLYYVAFLAITTIISLIEKGVLFQVFWSNTPQLNLSLALLSFFGIPFGLLFLQEFLETKKYARRLHQVTYVLMGAGAAGIVANLVGSYILGLVIAQVQALGFVIIGLLQMYVCNKNGNRKGILHVLGIISLFLFVVMYVLSQYGVLPDIFIFRNGLTIGIVLECILFSFALAKWIQEIQENKKTELERYSNYLILSEESLQSNVRKLKTNEDQLQEVNSKLKDSQETMRQIAEDQLEQSEALLKAERELQRALQEEKERKKLLLDTQSQLVNNEKMASLGQLTAGIAHEINNPINFIYNGIDTLKLTYSELKPIVNKVKEFGNGHDENLLIDEIVHLRNEYQITELKSDMHELVSDIKLGAVRTMEIVKGLRVFSRLDEEEQKPANINENIEATLVLLRNKTKNKIEIRKNFETSNQEILCYPGQLNQVFMNIIGNAIQAIPEDRNDGKIIITTELNEHTAIIRIKDNGVGMPESVRKRIFEPFFTTKPVGVGTGLGLSISYGIIEKHKGQMFVTSEEGKGTEFVIHIPRT